ncbi:MAG: helix-turn-helix transcriptional regulator [Candidatus Aenigmatarchaeota archaeon]|nr:MAG: helix-turn-helix transcriptional regulator [Candidatus Aenigmarchaeota archaeon]
MMDQKTPNMLEDLLLRDKPAKIILSLKTSKGSIYATILSRETNCTYSHTIKILDVLKDQGLVNFEKVGRIKKVKLTSDGWDVAQNLEALTKKFEQVCDKITKKTVPKKPRTKRKK